MSEQNILIRDIFLDLIVTIFSDFCTGPTSSLWFSLIVMLLSELNALPHYPITKNEVKREGLLDCEGEKI